MNLAAMKIPQPCRGKLSGKFDTLHFSTKKNYVEYKEGQGNSVMCVSYTGVGKRHISG